MSSRSNRAERRARARARQKAMSLEQQTVLEQLRADRPLDTGLKPVTPAQHRALRALAGKLNRSVPRATTRRQASSLIADLERQARTYRTVRLAGDTPTITRPHVTRSQRGGQTRP